MYSLPRVFGFAIRLQILYGIGVALWNGIGLALLATGRPALGPTASGSVALFALVATGALVALARGWPVLYVLLAAALAVPAGMAIQNAFVADPSLWPSPWARWGGVALNALGVTAPLLALVGLVQLRSGVQIER